jgi:hypothetical protein
VAFQAVRLWQVCGKNGTIETMKASVAAGSRRIEEAIGPGREVN